MKKKRIFILLAAVTLTLAGCANYDSDINRIDEELDRLENTRIKTITEQIDGINASLPKLEQADKDLKDMITSLEGTAGDLQKAIDANDFKIAAVKADLEKALAELREADTKDKEEVMAALIAAKAEITAKLEAMKTEAEGKLKDIEGAITELKEKDVQLDKRISELKEYVDKGLAGTKDWALKTFTTLESQKAIEEDIAAIKGDVEGLKKSLADLEKRLTEKFAKDLENAVSGLDTKITEQVKAITAAYTDAITAAKTEIESAYTAAIESAIKDLETSLKGWVNETLTAYSTVASTEAKIDALRTDLEGQLESQKTYLEGLVNALSKDMEGLTKVNSELAKLIKANADAIGENANAIADNKERIAKLESDLAAAKAEIKTAYEKAIGDAIGASEGKLTKDITDKIAEVNKTIDDKVTKVQNAVDALTVKVTDLEKSVQAISSDLNTLKNSVKDLEDRLNARIQSISYIPTYTDRVEEVYFTVGNINYIKDLTLQFEVMPHDMAQKITVDQVSGQATYPQTRAGSLTSFEVKSVSGDADGILTVVIDPIKFLNNDHYNSYYGTMSQAAIRVAVSDSKTGGSIASEYISVEPKKYDRFMSYTTTTGNELDRLCYSVYDNDGKKGKTVSSRNSETGEWTMSVPYGPRFDDDAGKIDFNMWYDKYYYPSPVARDNSLKKIFIKHAHPYYYLKDATRMFFKYINLEEADLAELRANDGISMKEMFIDCSKLGVVKLWNRNSSNNIMENVTSTDQMFEGCSSLNTLTLPEKVNSGKLESMSYMFNGCSSLTALDLSGWNLNNVTSMASLFQNCSGLTSVALPKVTTKKIQYMQRMFSGCSALTSLDLSGWNVETVTEMGDLFYNCSNLKDINLSGWAPKSLTEIYRMFSNCTSLESINLSGWNLENMKEIQSMFLCCSNLKTVDLSNWKTPKLSVLGRLITGCENLTYANLSGWDVSSLYQIDVYPFSGCVNLVTLDLSGWNLDKTIVDSRLFENCNNLKAVRMVGCSQTTIDKIKKILPSGATVVTK